MEANFKDYARGRDKMNDRNVKKGDFGGQLRR